MIPEQDYATQTNQVLSQVQGIIASTKRALTHGQRMELIINAMQMMCQASGLLYQVLVRELLTQEQIKAHTNGGKNAG